MRKTLCPEILKNTLKFMGIFSNFQKFNLVAGNFPNFKHFYLFLPDSVKFYAKVKKFEFFSAKLLFNLRNFERLSHNFIKF